MKVFSLLAGILIQEGRAACPDGKSIIEVTCHEDLTIQLASMCLPALQKP